MKRIAVLGAGMVGKAIAIDLAKRFKVTSFDIDKDRLAELSALDIHTALADLSDPDSIKTAVQAYDLVVGAVPGYMGFNMLKAVIEAGKDIVDISFFPEDPFLLSDLVKKNDVTAIVDCGVAPGLSHMCLGYHYERMEVSNFECYVGGLPKNSQWPWQYKAPFSPIDVIEEYTRPARLVENRTIVTKKALTEREIMDFPPVGELEAFNTDGLRSLLTTCKVPEMKEKTLRFPGHIEYIEVLKASGLFSEELTNVNGQQIRPIDLTTQLLLPQWKLEKEDREFTIMKVIVEGEGKRVEYDIYDEYHEATQTSSMARTTGYTCTAAVNLLAAGKFDTKGIIPPEWLVKDASCFNYVLDYLKEREISIKISES